jgi:hypothetical protein
MLRPIVRYGSAVLQQPARDVDAITPEITTLVGDMVETMYAAPGIGLAATQVGVALRIFVVDLSVGRDPAALITMINPVFVERDGTQLEEEGCLSVPDSPLPCCGHSARSCAAWIATATSTCVKGRDSSRARSSTRWITSTVGCSWIGCAASSAT